MNEDKPSQQESPTGTKVSAELTQKLTQEQSLLPTHTCFDDALDLIDGLVRNDPSLANTNEFLLVHAICKAPNGEEFAHAWVERDGQDCAFAGIINGKKEYFKTDKEDFYRTYKVKETTKYTVQEAFIENFASGHYGPWNPKYTSLCGRGHKIIYKAV